MMQTQCIDAKKQPVSGTRLGGRIIKQGGLVAFPTETVYGLGADGLNADAVRGIYEAKGRPADNPLILHIAKKSDVRALWDDVPRKARQLMDAFWPGPLTLVYNKSALVPDIVSAGLDTVAVRMPANKIARALIKAAQTPVAAPSANKSGRPSPTTAQHVLEDLGGIIPLVIDGGGTLHGVESTVLSVGAIPMLLRPGIVTQRMIEGVVGRIRVHARLLLPPDEGDTAVSPGMKHRHYAPDCQMLVFCGSLYGMARRIGEEYDARVAQNQDCVIFATQQTQHFYRGRKYVIIGDRDHPETLCANIFRLLRAWGSAADVILSESIAAEDAGLAFMNRLLRAAGYACIECRE
ncbi:MAG: threonylcarbamoyl-AMP synthase [Clostridiales bacterium]|jgi:L-threonylcarbamoyladenylate synthase|nr:threonylcarbamoyl-AMP synthase [Clostridiales bacterium]